MEHNIGIKFTIALIRKYNIHLKRSYLKVYHIHNLNLNQNNINYLIIKRKLKYKI